MSANPIHHQTPRELSGEQIFFARAGAFGVILVAIIAGAFMPLAVGIAVIFGVLAVVLGLFGVFLARVLSSG